MTVRLAATYRRPEEVAAWKSRDPIARYQAKLIGDRIVADADISEIKSAVERELDEAVAFAEKAPDPQPEECLTDVFAE